MEDVRKKVIVDCKITAHASPRWKGAPSERQRILENETLGRKRADVVKLNIQNQLRAKLSDYNLDFRFDQSVASDDSLPSNTVLIGSVNRGQQDSIIAAGGNRSNNDEQYRRVDVAVRIARKVEEDIPTKIVHKYKQPTKTNIWNVSVASGVGLHLGAGVSVIFIELRNLYQKATGVAYATGVGIGLSSIGEAISQMTKKQILRAAASASFGPEASFSTNTEVGFNDFHGRRIRYSSGAIQLIVGYEWSYLSFSNMGDGAQSISVGGPSLSADAAASLSSGVGLLYLFDVPDDYVIQRYTGTELHTNVSEWVTSHQLPLYFGTGRSDLGPAAPQLAEFTNKINKDFRDQ